MLNKSTYIYSIEGKDIINSNYNLNIKKGKKRKATLDYSLLTLKLDELNKKAFTGEDKQITNIIVNLSFNYSVKEFNMAYRLNTGTKSNKDKLIVYS